MSNQVFPLASLSGRVISREPFTSVKTTESASGKEYRTSWWSTPRYRYKLGFDSLREGPGTRQDFESIGSSVVRHFGQLDSFLLLDPEDSAYSNMGFGLGDGSTAAFQLQRSQIGPIYDGLGGPWSASSVPRTNYITNSVANGAGWGSDYASVWNGLALAPDGNPTATAIAFSTGNGNWYINNSLNLPPSVLFSCWARCASGTMSGVLRINDNTLSVVRGSTPIVITTTWQRFSVLCTGIVGANGNIPAILNLPGNGTLYTWGWQAEAPTASGAPSQYIATGGTKVTVNPAYWPAYSDGFEPCNDIVPGLVASISGGDGLGTRALSLASRTNIALQSQTIASWSTLGNTTAANGLAGAPDGTATACSITDNAVNGQHYLQNATTAVVGAPYCVSIYFKAGTLGFAAIGFQGAYFGVNLSTGAIDAGFSSGGVVAAVQACGSGWWRLSLVVVATVAASTVSIYVYATAGTTSYVGSGQTCYAWGAQVELAFSASAASNAPGDYIPTVAATASRTDISSISATGLVTLSTAPRAGASLTWTGSVYRRCRIDGPIVMEKIADSHYAVATLPLVSVL